VRGLFLLAVYNKIRFGVFYQLTKSLTPFYTISSFFFGAIP
jgi:hypothetical protein